MALPMLPPLVGEEEEGWESLPRDFRKCFKQPTDQQVWDIVSRCQALAKLNSDLPSRSLLQQCRCLATRAQTAGSEEAQGALARIQTQAQALSFRRKYTLWLRAVEARPGLVAPPSQRPQPPPTTSPQAGEEEETSALDWQSLMMPSYIVFDTERFDFRGLLLRIFSDILKVPNGHDDSAAAADKDDLYESNACNASGPEMRELGSIELCRLGKRRTIDTHRCMGDDPLSLLHETFMGQSELGYARPDTIYREMREAANDEEGFVPSKCKALDDATRYGCNVLNRIFKSSPHYEEFMRLYRDFVKHCIAPSLGCTELLYQTRPIFRAFLPGHLAIGPRHRDSQYHEQPNELNFWMPFTDSFDTNSLLVESCPGSGDFESITCGYGSIYRFYGNACEHFTELNLTKRTRLSLDFRIIRANDLSMCPVPESVSSSGTPLGSQSRKKSIHFAVGHYYTKLQKA